MGKRQISAVMLLLAAVAAGATGCGDGRLKVSKVRGKVVYKGQGVPNTTVIFVPVGETVQALGKMRPFAYGQPDGQFEIKTYVEGDGAPPGQYRVSIIAPAGGPGGSKKDRPADDQSSATSVQIPATVANKFKSAETSGIEVTIHEGENNLDPFELM